jgi:hypothetical protein
MPRNTAASFKKGNAIEKALQAYLVLIGMAQRRQITTYKEIGTILGYEGGMNVMGRILAPIVAWCEYHGLPPLAAIVVNSTAGFAKAELIYGKPEEWAAIVMRVFNEPWYNYYPPSVEDLAAAYKSWKRN